MRDSTLILAILVVALSHLGCGEGSNSTTSLSKEQFIKRAEKICGKAETKQRRAGPFYAEVHQREFEKLSPVGTEEEVIRAVIFPSIREQAKEIQAIGTPEGEERKVNQLFKALDSGLEKAEEDPYSIELSGTAYPFREYALLSRAYGFRECRNLG